MLYMGFPDGSVVNNPPANAGVVGSIPKSGRSPLKEKPTPVCGSKTGVYLQCHTFPSGKDSYL